MENIEEDKIMSRDKANFAKIYYVAPTGNDANPGTESKPFRTLEKARDVVRTVNQSMSGDILVLLRGGIYALGRTIVFNHTDSGTNGYNVVYRNYPGENVIISGGKKITGWQPDSAWQEDCRYYGFQYPSDACCP